MSLQTETPSRYSRKRPTPKGYRRALGIYDVPILEELHHDGPARTSFIASMVGGNPDYIARRLTFLHHELPHLIRKVSDPRLLHTETVWDITEDGEALLYDLERIPTTRVIRDPVQLEHKEMCAATWANIKYGIRTKGGARFVRFDEIRKHPEFVRASEGSVTLPAIPVEISTYIPSMRRAASAAFSYNNDGLRAIELPSGYIFLQIEAEHNKRVTSQGLTNSSFLKTFLAAKHVMDNRLYKKHWGIPNLLTLFVARSNAAAEHMKQAIMGATDGRGVAWALFRVLHPIDDETRVSKPNPDFFGKWQRAGYPDFDLTIGG